MAARAEAPLTDGVKLYREAKYAESAAYFGNQESTGNANEAVFLWQAKALVKSRKLSAAQDAVRRGLGHHPESTELEYLLGHVAALAGDTEQAKAQFRKIAGKHVGARSELAALEEGRTPSTESVPVEDTAEEIPAPGATTPVPAATAPSAPPPPDVPVSAQAQAAFAAGRMAMAKDTYEGYCQAIEEYERAQMAEPGCALTAAELAYARLWRTLVEREERRVNVLHIFGEPAQTKEEIARGFEQARADALRACEIDRDGAPGHAVLAIICGQTRRLIEASGELEAAKKISSDDRHTLMAVFILTRDNDERLKAAERLAESEPGNAQFMNWLAVASFKKGDPPEVVRPLLVKAICISPQADRPAMNLIVALEHGEPFIWSTQGVGQEDFKKLEPLVTQHPKRLRFERLMFWDSRVTFCFAAFAILAWVFGILFACFSDWNRGPANKEERKTAIQLWTAWVWGMVGTLAYFSLALVLTHPATMAPPGTLTLASASTMFLLWPKVTLIMALLTVLLWHWSAPALRRVRCGVVLVFGLLVPAAVVLWLTEDRIQSFLTRVTDSW